MGPTKRKSKELAKKKSWKSQPLEERDKLKTRQAVCEYMIHKCDNKKTPDMSLTLARRILPYFQKMQPTWAKLSPDDYQSNTCMAFIDFFGTVTDIIKEKKKLKSDIQKVKMGYSFDPDAPKNPESDSSSD